jgi:hypothetical protein
MSHDLIAILLLLGLSVTHYLEAWLEEIVILMKDGTLPGYQVLNHLEHSRSLVLSAAFALPYAVIAVALGLWWMLPTFVINRRLVYDPWLKIRRRRKLSRYEGDGPVDGFFSRILGPNGARWEILAELILTIGFTLLQLTY